MVLFELDMVSCLENETSFVQNYLKLLEFVASDPEKLVYQNFMVDYLKKVIKSTKQESLTKFLALMLVKQAVETYDLELLKYIQVKLLDALKLLGEYKNGSLPEEQQAEDMFGKKKNPHFAQAFFELNAECLKNWAATYGNVSGLTKYSKVYSQLKNKMVTQKNTYQL